jgi:hypothetical protein
MLGSPAAPDRYAFPEKRLAQIGLLRLAPGVYPPPKLVSFLMPNAAEVTVCAGGIREV